MYQKRETHVQTCLAVGLAWKQDPPNFFFVFLGGTPVPPLEKKNFHWGMGVGGGYSSNFSREQ